MQIRETINQQQLETFRKTRTIKKYQIKSIMKFKKLTEFSHESAEIQKIKIIQYILIFHVKKQNI